MLNVPATFKYDATADIKSVYEPTHLRYEK